MKIIQIVTRSDTIGGASAHVRDISNQLIKSGHDVEIFIGGEGPIIKVLEQEGILVRPIKNLVRHISVTRDFAAYCEIKAELKKSIPDIVACHSTKAGLLGRLACASLKIPCVFTAHGWSFNDEVGEIKASIFAFIERYLAKLSAHVIVVSEYDKQIAIDRKVVRKDRMTRIWNGIPQYGQNKLASQKIENNHVSSPIRAKIELIMVARFDSPKDHKALIKAISLIKSEKAFMVSLVGDGPLLDECKHYVSVLRLDTKVHFLGLRYDINTLLEKSDIFLLVSQSEGLPLSILEAMRARLPIIASAVGGIPEIVENNYNGFLHQKGNIEQLSSLITRLIENPSLRRQLGQRSRKKYLREFTVEKMTKQTLSIYQQSILDFKNLKGSEGYDCKKVENSQ